MSYMVIAALEDEIKGYCAEIDRLNAIDAELLVALKGVMPWAAKAVADHYNQKAGKRALDAAYEAIENAEAES